MNGSGLLAEGLSRVAAAGPAALPGLLFAFVCVLLLLLVVVLIVVVVVVVLSVSRFVLEACVVSLPLVDAEDLRSQKY